MGGSTRHFLNQPQPRTPARVSVVNHRSENGIMQMTIARSRSKPARTAALTAATALGTILFTAALTPAQAQQPATCNGDAGGITLSPGFCATVFADKLGHARHLVVAPNGVVYVNTWSGRYYHNDTPPPGWLPDCPAGHQGRRPGRQDRPLWSDPGGRQPRRHRHRDLQGLRLCRNERSHRALSAADRWDRTDRGAARPSCRACR